MSNIAERDNGAETVSNSNSTPSQSRILVDDANNNPEPQSGVDLSYLEARTLVISQNFRRIVLIQVGCGGTGSWLAAHLARFARLLQEQNQREVKVYLIDPDEVEEANLYRQNFCPAEIGRNKAVTLAQRYSQAVGLNIVAIPAYFSERQLNAVNLHYDDLVIVVGCVDTGEARHTIAQALTSSERYENLFWLDCGNYYNGGNVLIGNTDDAKKLQKSFQIEPWCTALPFPHLQHPELIQTVSGNKAMANTSNRFHSNIEADNNPNTVESEDLSCEELAVRSSQSLTVNQTIASVASNYLVKLLTGKLRFFQTYLNLDAMVIRSTYITPQVVSSFLSDGLTTSDQIG